MSAARRRILLTTTAFPPSVGGVQAHVAELRAHLAHFEADVLTLWTQNRTDWLLGTTLRLGELAAAPSEPGVTTVRWSGATKRRMLLWVFSYYANPAGMARRIAAQMVPYIDAVVEPDHVLLHHHRIGRPFLAQASLAVARKRGKPFVLTPHHHQKWRGYRYQDWIDVYRAADAVLALTTAERDELQRLGVEPDRIHVIWSAADPPLPADAARFRQRIDGSDAPLVLFMGQQYQYKGITELVAAVDMVRRRKVSAELVVIGPSTPFSERFFAQHSYPWLHLLGRVDEQTKWDALEASSVVCLPSRNEAFGRVYLEGWSKGKPVIGARIPTVQEVITEGKTGLLVEPGSSEQLAAAIERLLTNPSLAAEMGANGALELARRFSWSSVVERVEAAYAAVLDRDPSGRGV